MQQVRQGDVLLVRIGELPCEAKTTGNVVAHGENGHTHVMEGEASVLTIGSPDAELADRLFVEVTGPAELTHEEHGNITLEPGIYERVPQREYSPEEIRRVLD